MGNCTSGEILVGMYKLKEVMEKFVVIFWPHTKGSVFVLYQARQHGGSLVVER
jgi:hypothetical protein